jgi:hypothetical protein
MFVMNCSVVTDEKLRVPLKLKGESPDTPAQQISLTHALAVFSLRIDPLT